MIFNMKGGAEMNNNAFSTETSPQYVRLQSYKSLLIVFLVFSLAACLGFLVTWQTFMFFELIVIISCVVSLFQNNKKGHHWKLEFENDVLPIKQLGPITPIVNDTFTMGVILSFVSVRGTAQALPNGNDACSSNSSLSCC